MLNHSQHAQDECVNSDDRNQLSQIAVQLIEVNKELTHRAETAERQVEEAKLKTTFYDQFALADGLFGLQNAARALGMRPNLFIRRLKEKYLFHQGGELVPRVEYRQRGLFEVKCTYIDDKARYRTYITPKGLQHFADKFGDDQKLAV